MKKRVFSLLQLVAGLAILGVIFYRLHRSGELGKLMEAVHTAVDNWPFLVLAIAGMGLSVFFCTARWGYLLQAQGVDLPFRRQGTLYLIGQFFSAFMLGATGGDVVKAYYVATETEHKRAEVIATVVVDRIVGLIALVALVVVVMLCRLPFFLAHAETRVAIVFNLALLGGVTVVLLAVFQRNIFERWSLFRKLEQNTSIGEVLSRVYAAMRFCLGKRGLLPKVLFLSFLNHMSMVTWTLYLAKAIGIRNGFIDMLTIIPLVNTVATIPITPGGLGTRESAAIFLLGTVGIPPSQAVTLSLLCYSNILVWSLLGGIVYLAYAWQRGRPQLAEVE